MLFRDQTNYLAPLVYFSLAETWAVITIRPLWFPKQLTVCGSHRREVDHDRPYGHRYGHENGDANASANANVDGNANANGDRNANGTD